MVWDGGGGEGGLQQVGAGDRGPGTNRVSGSHIRIGGDQDRDPLRPSCITNISRKHQILHVINASEKAYAGSRNRLAIIQLCTISFFKFISIKKELIRRVLVQFYAYIHTQVDSGFLELSTLEKKYNACD